MITRANAQKMLPMLIPAFVAAERFLEDGDGAARGVTAFIVVAAGEIVGDNVVEVDTGDKEGTEEKDKAVDASDIEDKVDNVADNDPVDDEDVIAVGLEAPPSWARAETPQV